MAAEMVILPLMGKYFVAVVAVLLAGWGGTTLGGSTSNGRENVSFASAADIRDALSKAGLTCSGYETRGSGDREFFTEDAADEGACKLENENILMVVWKDNGQRTTGRERQKIWAARWERHLVRRQLTM